ncbi:MAG: long-chain fatty acid--CoA ligase [Chloroflexi bacterium]|nr:long-chain fatty acid--CoA ligase [Chloroflexota bacterium]
MDTSLYTLLERQASARGEQTYLYWRDEELSYAAFAHQVRQAAHGLRARGVGHGDKVALLLANCPEFLTAFFACAALGAVAVPINPRLKAEEVQYILQNSDSVLLIVAAELLPIVGPGLAGCPGLRQVLLVGTAAVSSIDLPVQPFRSLREGPADSLSVTVTPDDIASIIYTSGTTGRPKGVLLSHGNYLFDVWSYATACQISAHDRLLCMLPLFHVNAQVASVLSALYQGGALILLEGFSPREFLPALERYRATSFSAVPTIYAILNDLPDAAQYDLSNLRVCICGAAPMPVEVFERFEQSYKAFILEGYGLSEGTCVSTLNPLDGRARKIGSIGVALPGQEVRIVDEQGQPLPAGAVGEIVIRGPNVMQGYYKNPEATAASIRDGWLYTGDLGSCDAEGYFFIVGRKKEMIIRGGENIYPKEIEEVLYRHPAVAEAAVVGLPDPVWGEQVAAFIVVRPDSAVTAEALISHCQAHLADFKCPRVVAFTTALPKTATGKIQKNRLVEQYRHETAS